MAETEQPRRSSIGGKAPEAYNFEDVVEHIETHDSTPCAVAWRSNNIQPGRPIYSFQIYDTTPNSANRTHLGAVAKKIHLDTYDSREHDGQYYDRIDFYGLAMPLDTTQKARVRRCIVHQRAEILARNATGKTDYFIPKMDPNSQSRRGYRRLFYIIDKDEEEWDQGEGGFLAVQYEMVPPSRYEDDEKEEKEEDPLTPSWTYRVENLEQFGRDLYEERGCLTWFYDTFVGGGYIQEELKQFSKDSTTGGSDTEAKL